MERPQWKKPKVCTYDSLRNDIERSEFTIYQYENLKDACKDRSKEVENTKALRSVQGVVSEHLNKYLNLEIEEGEDDEPEDVEAARADKQLMINFLQNVQVLSASKVHEVLEYDRYEGDMSTADTLTIEFSYNNHALTFCLVVKHSSYGGENSDSASISDASGRTVNWSRTVQPTLWNLQFNLDEEGLYKFFEDCFYDISDGHMSREHYNFLEHL